MSSKKMDLGSKDLISSLPDALIGQILSFLSTKDAALTSVLSQRWRFLLAFVPNMEFETPLYYNPSTEELERKKIRTSFKLFVDRVMALQGNSLVKKFALRCRIGSDTSHVDRWILNVLERGVSDLDLFISKDYDYQLSPKVLMSKTLVKLRVEGTDKLTINVEEVFLPKLKTLFLVDVTFKDESGAAFAKLISGCHVLEEFVMIDVICYRWESFSVSNPNLKRVTIHCQLCGENPKSVSFDTPNLVYLEYSHYIAVKCPKLHFDSLVEASIGLRMTHNRIEDALDFLMGIRNVKILYLTSDTLKVLARRCKAIPVFNNLIHLTVETNTDVRWDSLPNLLENCPNLETLVFEGLHYRDTNQCMFESNRFRDTSECWVPGADRCVCKPWSDTPICVSSSPVKVLKVLKFGETSNDRDDFDKQTELINYFLETMPNLEQVILYYHTPFEGDLSILSSEIQMLKKVASPKCKIQIISDNISFSSSVSSSSSSSGPFFFKNTFPV